MPVKSVELIGTGGIVRDTPAHKLADGLFSDGNNIRIAELGIETIAGDLVTFSDASITPLWLGFFPPITSPRWAYGNLTEMWVVENVTHTEITRVSGNYAGITTQRWGATVFNGVGIFNNTIDIPQEWGDFDPTTKLIDLSNWDVTRRCKSLKAFKNYLIALNMTDGGINRPYRVLWSNSASAGTLPSSWDSTNPATDSREFDLAETSDYLVDQLSLGDINIIYKENSTWGMQFIGAPFYFRFWKILSKSGLLHRDCMVNIPGGHVVATQDDIIVHSGQVESLQSVLNKQLRRWLFQTIDPTNFRNCFMLANARRSEVYFCFPEVGETHANKIIIWNYRDNSIGTRDLTSTPFGATGPVGQSIIEDLEWGV